MPVNCSNCGFLTIIAHAHSEHVEASDKYRKTGLAASNVYEPQPVCFVRAANLEAESGKGEKEDILRVLRRERDCDDFTPWTVGYSPKEHREMLAEEKLRQWQAHQQERRDHWEAEQQDKARQWQESQREADRQYQELQRAADLKRQEAQRIDDQRRADRQKRIDRIWAVGTVVFAALVGFCFWWIQTLLNTTANK